MPSSLKSYDDHLSRVRLKMFEHGGPHTDDVEISENDIVNANKSLAWSETYGSKTKGNFPRMEDVDPEDYPNLMMGRNGFLAVAMARHYGYDGQIKMTSGERLGHDQWRVMREYQKNDMHLYSWPMQRIVKDSTKAFGWNSEKAQEKIVEWIDKQYERFKNGEITERQLRKLTSSHIAAKAGDFTGDFRDWLKSSESKKFRSDFNVHVLDEHDHFHVTFNDFNSDNFNDEMNAHLSMYDNMFENLATVNKLGQKRINLNPTAYDTKELMNLTTLEPIEVTEINTPLNEELELIQANPIQEINMPEPKKVNFLDRTLMGLGLKEYGGPNSGNVSAPQNVKTEPETNKSIKVNKHGYTDLEYYRKNKDNQEVILDLQNFLKDEGFDISVDGKWGNQTYKTANKYLVNKQLDNYDFNNFSEDQFLDQIYKESTGKANKKSPAGAIGLAQFKPKTFQELIDKGLLPPTANIMDPAAQSLAQRVYMDYLYNDVDAIESAGNNQVERQSRSFAAYNMGMGKFTNFWNSLSDEDKKAGWSTWYKKLPTKETKQYVLWMMDKDTYKKDYSTPFQRGVDKNGEPLMTSEWNDVSYGYDRWRKTNPKYRY